MNNIIISYPILIIDFLVVILCVYCLIAMIKHRRELSKASVFSISIIELGSVFILSYKTMWDMNILLSIREIIGILALLTFIPGLLILIIGGYLKAIRYNPALRKIFHILFGVCAACIVLFIFFTIMEMVSG